MSALWFVCSNNLLYVSYECLWLCVWMSVWMVYEWWLNEWKGCFMYKDMIFIEDDLLNMNIYFKIYNIFSNSLYTPSVATCSWRCQRIREYSFIENIIHEDKGVLHRFSSSQSVFRTEGEAWIRFCTSFGGRWVEPED